MAMMNKTTITQNRIKSPRLWLIVAAVAALFTDVFVTAMLAVGGYDFVYMLFTVLMMVLDVLLLVGALLSNYRFRYTRWQWITYAVLTAVMTGLNVVVYLFAAGGNFVTYLAGIMWLVVHVAAIVATVAASLRASKFSKKSLGAIICVAVLLALVCSYSVITAGSGIFGQGNGEEIRALVYSENEENGYTVSGVLNGKGNKIVIPDSFNGKQVETVDMSVFAAEGITAAEIRCSADVEFINYDALQNASENLRIEVPKDNVDEFREKFYAMSSDDFTSATVLRGFANSIVPGELAKDEVYVALKYDSTALMRADGDIIPVWIGKKGDTFSFDYCANEIDYVKFGSQHSDADLYWNISNNGGYIISALKDSTGSLIDGKKITESLDDVYVSFDKIYMLYIEDDNDAKYESPDTYRYSYVYGDKKSCRYVTVNTAQEVIEAIPSRQGFTLGWKYSVRETASKTELNDIAIVLGNLSTSQKELYVYPEWELNAPTELSAVSDAENNTRIYGEDISLSASAKPPVAGYSISYKWEKEGKDVSDSATYDIINIQPTQAGVYKVTATAYSDATSLTSEATTQITVVMQKRTLNFSWTVPEGNDLIYSATEKTIDYDYDLGQVINEDVITVSDNFTDNKVRNAGNYVLTLTLTGDCAAKYAIPSQDAVRNIEIRPKETEVSWGALESVYDGEYHTPTASAPGIGGETVVITVNGSIRNAGSALMTAVTSDTNYKLTKETATYVVTKKSVSAIWSDDPLVYNGEEQVLKVSALSGCIDGEEAATLQTVIYQGFETNAGSGYTSVATLPENSNYSLEASQAFEIDKKPATVTVAETTKWIYDGTSKNAFDYSVDGFIQSFDKVVGHTFTGTAVGAADAGTYEYTLELVYEGYDLYNNYDIDLTANGTLTIDKRVISLSWSTAMSFTYNGSEQKPSVRDIGNCVASEKSAMIEEFNAQIVARTDAGSGYDATVTLSEEDNYTFGSGSLTDSRQFSIAKKYMSITVNSASKTYDGTAYASYSVTVTGIVDRQEDVFTVSYTVKDSDSAPTDSPVDAGTYTVNAEISQGEKYKNYNVTVQNGTLTIRQREVSLVWDNTSFTYNGSTQKPSVTDIANCVAEDKESLMSFLNGQVSAQTNAGSYTAKVSLQSDGNYVFAGGVYNVSQSYTIAKKTITAVWDSNDVFEYDGTAHQPSLLTVSGAVDGETDAVVRGISMSAAQKDAGDYVAKATLPQGSNYQFDGGKNYSEKAYTIERKDLTVTVQNVTSTYNGSNNKTFSVKVDGLASTDTQGEVFSVSYTVKKGTAVVTDYKNAGSYTVEAKLTELGKYKNYNVSTVAGTLTVNKAVISLTWSETSFDFDGAAHKPVITDISGCVAAEKSALLSTLNNQISAQTTAGKHTATVTLAQDGNYVFSGSSYTSTCEFTINE